MVAYVICQMSVFDPETYRKYTDRTPPTVKRYGGRFLTRGDPVTTLEGDDYKGRLVIVEFPSEEAAKQWHADPDYVAATANRLAASTDNRVWVQEGRDNTTNPDPLV